MRPALQLALGLVLVAAPVALAGKPVPPPPTPPSDPAITFWRGDYTIMIANADGSSPYALLGPVNVRNGPSSYHRFPTWSPDGQWIVFGSDMPIKPPDHPELNATGTGLYMIRVDGSFLCKIVSTPDNEVHPAWSPVVPPGASTYKIAYDVLLGPRPCPTVCSELPCCATDVFLVDAVCDAGPAVNVTQTEAIEENRPSWSPDARQIAVSRQDDLAFPGGDVDTLAIYDLIGDTATLAVDIGHPPGAERCAYPSWSWGGDEIALTGTSSLGPYRIATYRLSTGAWTEIVQYPYATTAIYPVWTPDDARLIFEKDKAEIWIVDAVVGATPELLLKGDGRKPPGYRFPDRRSF
jgi:Tol biopolymer transport system component